MYAGIVLGIGALAGRQGGPVLTIAAAVAVALLFQPLRARAQRVANRLVYGERATPYQVLSDFADDMAGQLDYDQAVDRMVAVLASAIGATRTEAWMRVGAELRPGRGLAARFLAAGARPARGRRRGCPAFAAATRAVAVRHGNELLGALALQKPRNEPLTAAEDKLLQHLASQAGSSSAMAGSPRSCRPRSRSCGPRGGGWWRRRTPSGAESSGTCTTGRSSSSSPCRSSLACWSSRPRMPICVRELTPQLRARPGPRWTTCGT